MRRGPFTRGLYAALLAAAAGPACGAPAPAAPPDRAGAADFQSSWVQFRDAVLAHDLAGAAALTAFPLAVHGVTDDETRHVGRTSFAKAFDRMLKQEPDGPGSPSNLQRVRATPVLKDPGPGHVAVVGGMEFARTAAGPRLVRIYVDEE